MTLFKTLAGRGRGAGLIVLVVSLLSTWSLLSARAPALENETIRYAVSFPQAAHNQALISVTFPEVASGPFRVRMSRSSPGRYALHEFAKNVFAVTAEDGAGRALPVRQDEPYSWIVDGHDGSVTVTYRLFADRADGTYSQVAPTHAHLNIPSSFLWAEGYEDRPVEVSFTPLDPDWDVATQLVPTDDPFTFTAPDLQYFMDSPTLLGALAIREWTVADEEGEATIRIAARHAGTEDELEAFTERAKNVVNAQIAVFGGDVPEFDHGTYTFIAHYMPEASGDGMEHRNSTILTRSSGLEGGGDRHLGTLSHEFIHAWNVERLRPATLEPFDFTGTNPTPSLWFAEGFTSYYGPLTIHRAGESSVDDYLAGLVSGVNYVTHGPGRQFGGPRHMSLRAAFVDAARAVDPTYWDNTFISYYTYGAVIGLALDLTLRATFEDVTLDTYMQHLWARYGKPERPFRPEELERGLAEVTGDADFAARFFRLHIDGNALPDLGRLLARAGLALRPEKPDTAWLGPADLEARDEGVMVADRTWIGAPLYIAGLDRGDVIRAVDGRAVDEPDDVEEGLSGLRPGDTVTLEVRQGEAVRSVPVTLAAHPGLELVRVEAIGQALTPEAAAFRKAWLGSDR